MSISEAEIETLPWRFAKTMAKWPHWYIVPGRVDPVLYGRLLDAIDEYGVEQMWKRWRRKYWYPGDGYKYWYMPDGIINRARVDD